MLYIYVCKEKDKSILVLEENGFYETYTNIFIKNLAYSLKAEFYLWTDNEWHFVIKDRVAREIIHLPIKINNFSFMLSFLELMIDVGKYMYKNIQHSGIHFVSLLSENSYFDFGKSYFSYTYYLRFFEDNGKRCLLIPRENEDKNIEVAENILFQV